MRAVRELRFSYRPRFSLALKSMLFCLFAALFAYFEAVKGPDASLRGFSGPVAANILWIMVVGSLCAAGLFFYQTLKAHLPRPVLQLSGDTVTLAEGRSPVTLFYDDITAVNLTKIKNGGHLEVLHTKGRTTLSSDYFEDDAMFFRFAETLQARIEAAKASQAH